MDDLNIEKYKQYFHYGLNYNQDGILDCIILYSAKSVDKDEFRNNKESNALEFTIDKINNLYTQFKRFIELTDNRSKQWYSKVNKETVKDTIMERIEFLEKNNIISYVNYEPVYGIYITDRGASKYPLKVNGVQRYENIQEWIKKDIIPILEYLSKLEKENIYQYNSLFLDTKYARSICNIDFNSVEKIKKMYSLFLETVKPAREDVKSFWGEKITDKSKDFIDKNYPDYWTITELKEESKSPKYIKKIEQQGELLEMKTSCIDVINNIIAER